MSSQLFIPDRLEAVESASEEEANNSSGSASGSNSPTLGTSFFGKPPELGNERIKKVSVFFTVFTVVLLPSRVGVAWWVRSMINSIYF